jgi:hypothetical protein
LAANDGTANPAGDVLEPAARNERWEMTTYVYQSFEPGLFTVGFYSPDGKWHPESDHTSRDEAAERVHYLNGGAL